MNQKNFEVKEVKNDRFNDLHSKMVEYVEQKELPCAITLVYQNDEIIYCEKQGMADIEKNVPIEIDSIFRIASMTKPITVVAALMLYEEGKFSLDDPVSKFIPKAKELRVFSKEEGGKIITEELNKELTILELFTHTSGFSYLADLTHHVDKKFAGLFQDKNHKSLAEAVNALFDVPLLFQPRTKFKYGLSIDILGYLIEILSGMPLDKFLQERIFNKLGMKDTGFFVPLEKRDRMVRLYTKDSKRRLIPVPETQQSFGVWNSFEKPRIFSGGGGLVSTLSDYLKFTVMLLNNGRFKETRLLKEETIRLMTSDYVISRDIPYVNEDSFRLLPKHLVKLMLEVAEGTGFGLGVKIQLEDGAFPAGCHGWGGAFGTNYLVDPKNNSVCIFLTQHFPDFNLTESYTMRIRKLVYEGLLS
ncbi:MAG: beta-lactamase family protein [Candidatus Lokiarchaeota archaeon]|nr:beta-lactamase family protein [Candidatus Lokiarchaeota archaeon]